MDYRQFEPDYPARMFKDRRKKKCVTPDGKKPKHRYESIAGDCDWKMWSYWWMEKEHWNWVCLCRKTCKDCGHEARKTCANKQFKELLRPEGVPKTKWG